MKTIIRKRKLQGGGPPTIDLTPQPPRYPPQTESLGNILYFIVQKHVSQNKRICRTRVGKL